MAGDTDNTSDLSGKATGKRKVHWLFYVIVGIALFLLVLPELIRFGAQYALEELNAETAVIEDVDLNLFNGRAAIEGLQVTYDGKETFGLGYLLVDLDMSALWDKKILIEEAIVSNLQLQAYEEAGNWVVAIPLPTSETGEESAQLEQEQPTEPSEWSFGVASAMLDQIRLQGQYQNNTHELKLDELFAGNLYMWAPDDQADLKFKGSINQAPIAFNSELKPFAQSRTFSMQFNLTTLDLKPINQFLPADIQKLQARLSLDTDVDLTLSTEGNISVKQRGTIALALDDFAIPDLNARLDDVRWQGDIDVAITKDVQPIIKAKGEVALAGLKAAYAPLAVRTQLATLKWQGTTGVDLAKLDESLKSTGNVTLSDWQLHDEQENGQLASFNRLAITEVAVDGLPNISLQQLSLENLQALVSNTNAGDAAPKALASMGNFKLDNLQLKQQNDLSIAAVTIDSITADLVRSSEGKIEVLDTWLASLLARLDAMGKGKEPAPGSDPIAEAATVADNEETADPQSGTGPIAESAAAPAFSYRVDKINFSGTNKITFTDNGVKPAIEHPVLIEKIDIGTIDSREVANLTPLDVSLKLYEHGSLKVAGNAAPLQDISQMNADITASIKGIELPELSPYLENTVGYHASSGQLNVDAKAAIKTGKLDSETKVKVLRIDLDATDEELIAKMSKEIAMPVETALNVITDSDDNLKIKIPVQGDLSNPDIDIGTIVSGAVVQAVKNSAMTYFKYAVQPFGAILLVSETIGDMTLQARFKDVEFVPGKAEIVAEQQGYMEKVAGMILEKKDFSILVCVMVTDQDFQAREKPVVLEKDQKYQWDDISKQLAKSRLNLIKSQLIDTYGLPADRVQSCKPKLNSGIPRAIMGI